MIVEPLRDEPGMSAMHCPAPMIHASFALNSSFGRNPRRFAYPSATCIRMAMKTSWNVTTHVPRNTPSICSSRSTPTITMGIVAKMTYHASRESGSANGFRAISPRKKPTVNRTMSLKK
jgi:hypothetical protein